MTACLWALFVAAAPGPAPLPRLPLRALVLYENGLGYFERRGEVPAGREAWIPLEPGQLDDALKTLVVMSARGVGSVEFEPPLSPEAARAQAGMPEEPPQGSLPDLLASMKGVDVRVSQRDGKVLRGRVVEVVQEEERDKEGNPYTVELLLVFGEEGLLRVPLRQVTAVRPVDAAVQQSWDRATGAQATHLGQSWLKVRGSAAPGAVAVGYTTEAPVWRTTYRLVLGAAAPPRLQGFALVHNASDEPWEGVRVTVASGRPSSFLMPLAGPRYGRRELVTPQDGLDAAPQLATQEAREHLLGNSGVNGSAGLGLSGHGSGGGGYGHGTGTLGTVGRGGIAAQVASAPSDLLKDGPTPLAPAAVSEAGDLFLYTVKEPVHLGARRSALLPIVDARAEAQRVTVVDVGGAAWLGLRFVNSTGLTLEEGTVSVFTDGTYAGEAQLDRVKPGEVRVVRHGEDLDLDLRRGQQAKGGPVRAVRRVGTAEKPALELHRVNRLVHHLELTSRAAVPRTLLVQLPREGYRVVQGAEEDVRSPGEPRYARVTLGPKEKKTVEVVEEGAFAEVLPFEGLTPARLDAELAQVQDAQARAALQDARAHVARAASARERLDAVAAHLRTLEQDVARTRENLQAAGKGGAQDAARKLGDKLLALEDALARARDERAGLERELQGARLALLGRRAP